MKIPTPLRSSLLLLCLSLFCCLGAYGQITPTDDSYTNTGAATTNFGAAALLDVDAASQIAYIRFNLASIPAGARVSQATLKLYVNSITTVGTFNVDYVNGAWNENTIDASNAPPLGTAIVSGVSVTPADVNQYILINITLAVQAWLNGSQTNDGIALVANTTFNATFDSKENTGTSHPPELDVVFEAVQGVTTASGSGLTGGGTGGTLNLSLSTACAAKQVLQWTGSAWACSSSTGTGALTGVTAGTDLTGGGTGGNVTLNLDTSKVPQLAAANTFTGNQTVKGSLSATGAVSGHTLNIDGAAFGFGSGGLQNAFLGFAGNSTMTGTRNTATGLLAFNSNTTGSEDTAIGQGALLLNTKGNSNTALGWFALSNNVAGGQNTALGANANVAANGFTNTTAIGANAWVAESNALVLGSIAGTNGAKANTNVGIGTTQPGFPLVVQRSDATGTGVQTRTVNTSTTKNSFAIFTAHSAGAVTTEMLADGLGTGPLGTPSGVFGTFSDHPVGLVTGNGFRIFITTSGKVGIDTLNPTNILTLAAGGGNALADGWHTYSSRRWKTNIETIHGALSKVEQLRGVSYDAKASGKHEVGVIAEEVGAVVPEVVSWEENGKDARGVDYSRLTAVLIEAVKEQQREISALRTQLRKRAARDAMLESRLARLEGDKRQSMGVASERTVH